MVDAHALQELAEVSARIGHDIALVQGPGGNSSIKDNSILWVKGSGVWLSEALDKPIFVPIDRSALGGADAGYEVPAHAVLADRNAAGLRPSIETALHSLMPHRVVLHAHAVNSMAVSVMVEGREIANARLQGIDWGWVDYRRPGAPLAIEIAAMVGAAGPDVLLLQNHGIVIGGTDAAHAEALLREVERRLEMPSRAIDVSPPLALSAFETDNFEGHLNGSPFAFDDASVAILSEAPLIPDQVVFLGGAVPTVTPDDDIDRVARTIESDTGVYPALLLMPGVGAFAARSRSAAADALISGLLAIASRIPDGAAVRGLGDQDVAALLGWDAEHHRRALDARRARV